MKLRPYQQEAATNIFIDLISGNSPLATMATGTGKTIVISDVIKHYLDMGEKVLLIAHREEIIAQAFEKIILYTDMNYLDVSIEMGSNKGSPFSKVVLATVQTMKGKRLVEWDKEHFGLIVVDEAHHAAANSYIAVIEHFSGARVMGVTATPERQDRKDISTIFNSLAYDYSIQTAISEGYLVDLTTKMVIVDGLDLKRVKVNKKQGDFNEESLNEEMTKKSNIWGVAKPLMELTEDRRTIVFATSVFHAEAITEILNSISPGIASCVDGSSSHLHRKNSLEAFRNGSIRYLVNCQVFTEGVDIPEIDCVAVARPTRSKSLYMQMIGRGTRTYAGKSDCLIIDFTDNCENHSIISVFDIYDTGDIEDSVKQEAARLSSESSSAKVEEVLIKAKIIAEQRERAKAKDRVNYTVREVDPFSLLGVYSRPSMMDEPITERQKILLGKMGVPTMVNGLEVSKKDAARLIAKSFERRRKNLSSFRQIACLMKHGIVADKLSFDEATKLVKAIANNGWRLPDEYKRAD